jgi:hypothetical protein
MSDSAQLERGPDAQTVTVHIPLTFRRRGGRKRVVLPDGSCAPAVQRPQVDSTLVKALARAHRWQRMLESGGYASVAELAQAERINSSYLARVLRLTLLSPEIVQSILDGRHDPERIRMDTLMKPFSALWGEQGTIPTSA